MTASPAPQGGQPEPLTHEQKLEALRKPFPPEAVGKLFKAFQKQPPNGPKATCRECGAYHSTAPGIHLNYVGHAAVRQRLLLVDPEWNWKPMGRAPDGTPAMVFSAEGVPMRMWIELTVLGVTRPGVGSVDPGAFDAEKQLIGDAIRNAAMSFGVALELWSKDELESAVGEVEAPAAKTPKPPKDTRPAVEKELAVATATQIEVNSGKTADKARAEMGAAFDRPAQAAQEAAGSTQKSRKVLGLPVEIDWQSARWGLIGKNCADVPPGVPSTTQLDQKTWEWASLGSSQGERERFLEALIGKAREVFKRDGKLPANLQAAVLAYESMTARFAKAPITEKDV